MGEFALDIREFVESTKERADEACRAIGLELLTRIVLKSPVGNPELWKVNRGAVEFNNAVSAFNSALRENPENVDRRGRLKRGKKDNRKRGISKPAGYTGGSFRRNWQLTIGSRAAGQKEGVDPSGRIAIADAQAAISTFKAGPAIFITNNLVYGPRLEMGYSTQAPAGVVRVTLVEFDAVVKNAVSRAP